MDFLGAPTRGHDRQSTESFEGEEGYRLGKEGTQISTSCVVFELAHLQFSNICPTPSRREDLLREIEGLKMPDTQFFGACVGREVNITAATAMKRLAATSGFLFAPEEEICDDYISEGFYRALNLSYIPVVFGGRDVGYDEAALAGTYVDAFDFDDGREIIQFLRCVSYKAHIIRTPNAELERGL